MAEILSRSRTGGAVEYVRTEPIICEPLRGVLESLVHASDMHEHFTITSLVIVLHSIWVIDARHPVEGSFQTRIVYIWRNLKYLVEIRLGGPYRFEESVSEVRKDDYRECVAIMVMRFRDSRNERSIWAAREQFPGQ
jgi:hypothetical protein